MALEITADAALCHRLPIAVDHPKSSRFRDKHSQLASSMSLRRDTQLSALSSLQEDRMIKVVYFTWLGSFEVVVRVVELQTREATP